MGTALQHRADFASGSHPAASHRTKPETLALAMIGRTTAILFYSPNSYTQQSDGIWAVSIDGDRKARQILAHGTNATLSP
jgi:sarcosine oxidase gamma subunit